tara:strand:- start:373 stop:540 length:168 start_codon:yes stop_codon:yes gene_type:complete
MAKRMEIAALQENIFLGNHRALGTYKTRNRRTAEATPYPKPKRLKFTKVSRRRIG